MSMIVVRGIGLRKIRYVSAAQRPLTSLMESLTTLEVSTKIYD